MRVRGPVLGAWAMVAIMGGMVVAPFGFWSIDDEDTDAGVVPLPSTGVLRASVSNVNAGGATHAWPTFDAMGVPTGTASWRAFTVGGNCCEHYVATTPDGWIVNLGGGRPTFSTDGGTSWQRASPTFPLVGAEGAVVAAPGGDIVGMTWDPYTGDQIVAYKYDTAADEWYWNVVNLNTPFFDRPWMSVAPGPFEVDGVEIPYVTLMRGGALKYPQYMSVDGLHYVSIEATWATMAANAASVEGVTSTAELPDFGADASLDFLVPHHSALGAPLPRGGYLSPIPHLPDTLRYAVLDQDLTWKAFTGDLPGAEVFFDADGNVHQLELFGNAWLYHRLSTDGGGTWTEYRHAWTGGSIDHWDFKVNAELGLAVVSVHLDFGSFDQDIVLKTWDYVTDLTPDEVMYVGAGNLDFGQGLLSSQSRMDFTTLGILPDGRVVTGFGDRSYQPGFAIEQGVPGASVGAEPIDVSGAT